MPGVSTYLPSTRRTSPAGAYSMRGPASRNRAGSLLDHRSGGSTTCASTSISGGILASRSLGRSARVVCSAMIHLCILNSLYIISLK